MLLRILFFFFLFNSFSFAQSNWTLISEDKISDIVKNRQNDWRFYRLNKKQISNELNLIKFDKNIRRSIELILPNEKGDFESFNLMPAKVLSSELQSKYPNVKTYLGISNDRRNVKVRLSDSPLGVNIWILMPNGLNHFVQPLKDDSRVYFSYLRSEKPFSEVFKCYTKTEDKTTSSYLKSKNIASSQLELSENIKTFRIAISATGEFTSFWGDDDDSNGTNSEDAFAAVASTINRVNEVFENDLGIHLELVSDSSLLYDNPETDPYTDDLNEEVQKTLDDVFGSENYDVGQVFDYGQADGNAGYIGSVCIDSKKGSAYTSHPFISTSGGVFMNDYFDLDYVAHELGHQFGAFHTFSHNMEGAGVNSEPGSGSTIMGYAGITGLDNVALHGDPYFHYYSIKNITDYVESSSCFSSESVNNQSPIVSAGEDIVIPMGTAYELIAEAGDPDLDILYYCWEQLDNGQVDATNFGPDKVNGAQARSLPPSLLNYRYIPNMTAILNGNLTQRNPSTNDNWETVSNVDRTLTWGITIRDRSADTIGQQGRTASDKKIITVDSNLGPFKIISQNQTGLLWEAGSRQIINWDVAGTNLSPIETKNVNIYFSADGFNSSEILLENTPNDGSAEVIVPSTVSSTNARIMIKPDNSIYFAVNKKDISVIQSPFVIKFQNFIQEICDQNMGQFNFDYSTYLNFNEDVNLTIDDLPQGLTFNISPDKLNNSTSSGEVKIFGLENLSPQDIHISLKAESASVSRSFDFDLNYRTDDVNPPELLSPEDNLEEVSLSTTLTWNDDENVSTYHIQISKDTDFQEIIFSENIDQNFYNIDKLEFNSNYFWRVKSINNCSESNFSNPFSFKTQKITCGLYESENLPISLNDATSLDESGLTVTNIEIPDIVNIVDIDVNLTLTHTWVEDLRIYLVSPDGTKVTLSQNSGGDGDNYTETVFDQDSQVSISSANAPFTGSFRPVGSLDIYNGERANGTWILQIVDQGPQDTGELIDFSIQICYTGDILKNSDGDIYADVYDNCPNVYNDDQSDIDNNGIGDLCDFYTQDNFTLTKKDASCIGKNNGEIDISSRAIFNYKAEIISNNGFFETKQFNSLSGLKLTELSPGDYEICITTIEEAEFQTCFLAKINEPKELEVSSVLNIEDKILSLSLNGASRYYIKLNDRNITVNSSGIYQFKLNKELNSIEVTTDINCQGKFEEEIYISQSSKIYPNPVLDQINVMVGGTNNKVKLLLFNINGVLLEEKEILFDKYQRDFIFNMDNYPRGMYLISVQSEGKIENFKFLKL